MAKKNYVVAEGMAFTAMGHIFTAGEEIPESVFSDKGYFAKMISEGKIVQKEKEASIETSEEKTEETFAEEAEETPVEETEETSEEKTEETSAEGPATKRSTTKGGK